MPVKVITVLRETFTPVSEALLGELVGMFSGCVVSFLKVEWASKATVLVVLP